ncbi:MAG: hypothetical protein H7144_10540, partial [Burkholderiales bacterium]|nr:hypothetical protein [Phycisphaerae bacterium]
AMKSVLEPAQLASMHVACRALRPSLSYEFHLQRLLAIYQRIVDAHA